MIICSLLFISWEATAHNPLTAKVELNTNLSEGGLLNIYLAQAGLHQALVKYFPATDFPTISTDAYKKLAVRYLKEHIHLSVDDTPLVIGEGGIKLGNHQTDLRFLINHFPKNTKTIQAHIDIGKENGNHHTVFWWLNKNAKTKVVLSEQNNFQSILNFDSPIAPAPTHAGFYEKTTIICLLAVGFLIALIWMVFPYKDKQKLRPIKG